MMRTLAGSGRAGSGPAFSASPNNSRRLTSAPTPSTRSATPLTPIAM